MEQVDELIGGESCRELHCGRTGLSAAILVQFEGDRRPQRHKFKEKIKESGK